MTALFLASRSPRRRELLAEAGIPFELVDGEVDETFPAGLAPEGVVAMLAEKKARAGAGRVLRGLVLGADTVVAVGSEILNKPLDREDARRMLRLLSGTTHRVLTAIALVEVPGDRAVVAVDTTRVTMRPLSRAEIDAYVASGECDDKAGAYAIQETGDRFVTKVDGSWSNVVGLPMELLRATLATFPRPSPQS